VIELTALKIDALFGCLFRRALARLWLGRLVDN